MRISMRMLWSQSPLPVPARSLDQAGKSARRGPAARPGRHRPTGGGRAGGRPAWRPRVLLGLVGALGTVSLACGRLTDLELPAGISDPATFRTPAGALGMARTVVTDFEVVVGGYAASAGLLTDELQDYQYGGSVLSHSDGNDSYLDARQLPDGENTSGTGFVYNALHVVRRDAVQAIGALATYDSGAHPALMAEAYALEGYAEVLLADLFCSGVPLSTLTFGGDFVYRPGSTTQEVYQHAVTLFDSALVLAGDSARVQNLARVGKGRALINLGDYAGAAASVAAVPDTFDYQLPVFWDGVNPTGGLSTFLAQQTSVSDREGGRLAYRSSGDPRTQVVATGTNKNGRPVYFPAKYGAPGRTTPLVLASGAEARLIEAEAALHANPDDGQWLTLLNALRTSCTAVTSCPTPAPAGTRGVAGLPPLADPGQAAARLDTLFAERAAWLFVTGSRQGDLRRLIRLYNRPPDTVYPSGVYNGSLGAYGTDVTVAIPVTERYNPLFTGCFDRRA